MLIAAGSSMIGALCRVKQVCVYVCELYFYSVTRTLHAESTSDVVEESNGRRTERLMKHFPSPWL